MKRACGQLVMITQRQGSTSRGFELQITSSCGDGQVSKTVENRLVFTIFYITGPVIINEGWVFQETLICVP
jgi:hypothetical protein